MKTIRLGFLSALTFSAALGAASAQSVQSSQEPTTAAPAVKTQIDCMDRDGGSTGCDLMGVRDATMRGATAQAEAGADAPVVPGFVLASARMDVVAGHTSQVLIYKGADKGAKGTVTLCVWPSNGEPAKAVSNMVMKGTDISYWNDGKTEFWAASPAPETTLDGFVRALTKS
jgi:hypothetical protein